MNRIKTAKSHAMTPGKIILLSFLSLLFVILTLLYLYLTFYKPAIPENTTFPTIKTPDISDPNISAGSNVTQTDVTEPPGRTDGYYSFLIAGIDVASNLTDVIMVVSFDVKNGKISVLQVPRDSYVDTDKSVKKFNTVYAYAYNNAVAREGKNAKEARVVGMEALSNMVKKTFGLPVDWYMLVDLSGFRAIVDAVGGVYVNVPINMDYDDPDQDLYIHLRKGYQRLMGPDAEQFVRFRQNNDKSGYPDGDIGRIRSQKMFLSALFKKISSQNVVQILSLTDIVASYVYTNMSVADAGFFAKEILKLKASDIRMHTVPGEDLTISGTAYYQIYKNETMQIVNKYYNPYNFELTEDFVSIKEFPRKYSTEVNIDGDTADKFLTN